MRLAPHPLIYDWNHDASPEGPGKPVAMLDDETLRARLGKAGRQNAENYGWPKVTSAVLDVYTAVLGNAKVMG